MVDLTFLEERGGGVAWQTLAGLAAAAERSGALPEDARAALKERLKSEVLPLVLNSLTALHTVSINCGPAVRDHLAHPAAKLLKQLERLLSRPPIPGVEAAAAQLLLDWSFLFGREELGVRAGGLISGARLRPLLAQLRPTDAAVVEREQRRVGVPRFVPFVRGYDFGSAYAHPLDGPAPCSTTPVMAAFARQVLQETPAGGSGSGGGTSGRTTPAPAEGSPEAPRAIADQVLRSLAAARADVAALTAAQKAASSAASARRIDREALSAQLDAAFAAAARCDSWRQKVAAAVAGGAGGSASDAGGGAAAAGSAGHARWQCLSSSQMSQLLALTDEINAALDGWARCSRDELWRGLGGGRSGGKSGGAAAGRAGSAGPAAEGTLVDVGEAGRRMQYLDLLTGDNFSASGSSGNPFLAAAAPAPPSPPAAAPAAGSTGDSSDGGGGGGAGPPPNPFAGAALPPSLAAAAAAAARRPPPTSPNTIQTHPLDLFADESPEAGQQQRQQLQPGRAPPQPPAKQQQQQQPPPLVVRGMVSSVSGSMDEEAATAAAAAARSHAARLHAQARALSQPGAAPAPLPPLAPALRQRLHSALTAAAAHARARCGSCGVPPPAELAPAVERVVAEVIADYEARAAAAEAAHRAEVAELKATAVRRLKEVMGQR
ncbi:hypothetical protein Rsub_00421 [Raphidocelis subcapitata]|uniref:VHS domain-containing protein n=1 Tax=Raphidocelis subcapitata TaxID=307507 RepID=A0A2V0NQA2_9CHLO|nr:hypothetical protein Rsub_00421 [Raphidocelis subcapitata]|eukprot:GBF87710.1 hypothetical protein Rsub_00421 [Raphidocelis subcapitata]